jgi:hypothetical protein
MFWLHKKLNSMLAVFSFLSFINCWVPSVNYFFVTVVFVSTFFRISDWIFAGYANAECNALIRTSKDEVSIILHVCTPMHPGEKPNQQAHYPNQYDKRPDQQHCGRIG